MTLKRKKAQGRNNIMYNTLTNRFAQIKIDAIQFEGSLFIFTFGYKYFPFLIYFLYSMKEG
jgi:hypothetical protein